MSTRSSRASWSAPSTGCGTCARRRRSTHARPPTWSRSTASSRRTSGGASSPKRRRYRARLGPRGRHPTKGVFPLQRECVSLHAPAEERRVPHVRSEHFHRIEVRDLPHEIHERLLVLPRGKGPEPVSEEFRSEREPDETRCLRELMGDGPRTTHEGQHLAIPFQRQIRQEDEVLLCGIGGPHRCPRRVDDGFHASVCHPVFLNQIKVVFPRPSWPR